MFPQPNKLTFASGLTLIGVVLSLGLLWLLNPPATYAQNQPQALGSLSGVVRNAQGYPLPDITVWLQSATGDYAQRKVTTDAKGGYEFLSVFSGDYHLFFQDGGEAYAPAYYTSAHFVEEAKSVSVNGNAVSGVNMALQGAGAISIALQNADPFTTTFYVLTLYRQTPSGRWQADRVESTLPGENAVRIRGSAAGTYQLCVETHTMDNARVSMECYDNVLPEFGNQLPKNASNIHIKSGTETHLAITVNDISQLQGFIFRDNHQPAAGISVILMQGLGFFVQSTKTDQNGYFRFGAVGSDVIALIYNYDYQNYAYQEENAYLTGVYPDPRTGSGGSPLVIDQSVRLSVTLNLAPQSHIVGKITLPHNVPVDSASIGVYTPTPDGAWAQPLCYDYVLCPQTIYDPSTGVYTVSQLTAGNYRLVAYDGGSQRLFAYYGGYSLETAATIAVATGETKKDINFSLGRKDFDSSISGRVTANNQPLKGIEVGLFTFTSDPFATKSQMPFLSTTTDDEGHYRLEGLANRGYIMGFRDPAGIYATAMYTDAASYAPYQEAFVSITQTGEISNINMTLIPGATIRGHVRTYQDEPPGGYAVQVIPYGFDPSSTPPRPFVDERSDADGYFEITGLPPGTYLLRLQLPSDPSLYRYYPTGGDASAARPITVRSGQTLEGHDIYFFVTPNTFLPVIQGSVSIR